MAVEAAVRRTIQRYHSVPRGDRIYVSIKLHTDPLTRLLAALPGDFGRVLDAGAGRGQFGLFLWELGRCTELRGFDTDARKERKACITQGRSHTSPIIAVVFRAMCISSATWEKAALRPAPAYRKQQRMLGIDHACLRAPATSLDDALASAWTCLTCSTKSQGYRLLQPLPDGGAALRAADAGPPFLRHRRAFRHGYRSTIGVVTMNSFPPCAPC